MRYAPLCGRTIFSSALGDQCKFADMIAPKEKFLIFQDFLCLNSGKLHGISVIEHIVFPLPEMNEGSFLLYSIAGITTGYLIYAFPKKYVNH
jgi:hypothetical protein